MPDLKTRLLAAIEGVLSEGEGDYTSGIKDRHAQLMRLEAYEKLPAEDKAKLAKYGWSGWFCWGAAVSALGLKGDEAFLVQRGAHGAGVFGPGGNYGRWVFADATSDEKVPGAIAIRTDEDPADVLAWKLQSIAENPEVNPADPRFSDE